MHCAEVEIALSAHCLHIFIQFHFKKIRFRWQRYEKIQKILDKVAIVYMFQREMNIMFVRILKLASSIQRIAPIPYTLLNNCFHSVHFEVYYPIYSWIILSSMYYWIHSMQTLTCGYVNSRHNTVQSKQVPMHMHMHISSKWKMFKMKDISNSC